MLPHFPRYMRVPRSSDYQLEIRCSTDKSMAQFCCRGEFWQPEFRSTRCQLENTCRSRLMGRRVLPYLCGFPLLFLLLQRMVIEIGRSSYRKTSPRVWE